MTTQITTDQIITLQAEAGAAGDWLTVEDCDRAIEGDTEARERLSAIIAEARGQAGDPTTYAGGQYRTIADCIDAICADYMTACGTTNEATVREMLADATDDQLVDEMRRDWPTPHGRAELIDGMARLRGRMIEQAA